MHRCANNANAQRTFKEQEGKTREREEGKETGPSRGREMLAKCCAIERPPKVFADLWRPLDPRNAMLSMPEY